VKDKHARKSTIGIASTEGRGRLQKASWASPRRGAKG